MERYLGGHEGYWWQEFQSRDVYGLWIVVSYDCFFGPKAEHIGKVKPFGGHFEVHPKWVQGMYSVATLEAAKAYLQERHEEKRARSVHAALRALI